MSAGAAARTVLAYNGSSIDGGLYTDVTDWARRAPSALDSAVSAWTTVGFVVLALLMLAAWWRARGQGDRVMGRVLASPVASVVAAVVVLGVKSVVKETRPCLSLPHSFTLESCPAPSDYAFPSNHTAIMVAGATVLWFANRKLGAVALLASLVMAASRVWVGAHYPHDVAAALVLGVLVGVVMVAIADRVATPLVARARRGPLRSLVGVESGAGAGAGLR